MNLTLESSDQLIRGDPFSICFTDNSIIRIFFILLYKILNEEITLDKRSLLQKRKIKNATCSKFSKNFIHNKITKIHKGLVLLGLFDIFTVVT